MRGLVFKKGCENGTDMYAIVFNALGGKDLLNAPIFKGMPYGRQGNTIYMKTNVVNSANTTKARFPFGLEFSSVESADFFESWLKGITVTKNCFKIKSANALSPATVPLLIAAHAQVDAALRSPPSNKVLQKAGKDSSQEGTPLKSASAKQLLTLRGNEYGDFIDVDRPQKKIKTNSGAVAAKRKRESDSHRIQVVAKQIVDFEMNSGIKFDLQLFLSNVTNGQPGNVGDEVVENNPSGKVADESVNKKIDNESEDDKKGIVITLKRDDKGEPSDSEGSSSGDEEEVYLKWDGSPIQSQKQDYWN